MNDIIINVSQPSIRSTEHEEWSVANSRFNTYRGNHLKRTYGITVVEYDELLEKQGGVCAICFEVCVTGKRLAVDHDHTSGIVRGLLCSRCNVGIGSLRNIDNLQSAIQYLDRGTITDGTD